MSDPLTDLITDVQNNGVRWVTLVTIYMLFRKERRNTLLNRRDAANFANQREVMNALGVGDKWKDGPKHGLLQMDLPLLRRFFLLSHKETIRRRMNMEKLKSRKFWLTILAALIPVLNVEFGINLDLGSIVSIMTAIMAGVGFLAHVDAKKVLASIIKPSATLTVDSTATYTNTFSTIKAVHDGINDLLKLAKENDTVTLAVYGPLLSIIKSAEQATPVKEPEAEVIESQVPA